MLELRTKGRVGARTRRGIMGLATVGLLWATAMTSGDLNEHARRGGDAVSGPGGDCAAAQEFPPPRPGAGDPAGVVSAFRNWCFGNMHQRLYFLDSANNTSWPRHGHLYSEWGHPRNMDLVAGRVPGNYAPVAHDVVAGTSPFVPADAAYRPSPRSTPDRPMIEQSVDMITGSPLLRQIDLELPFGGATYRLMRTYSEPSVFDRVALHGGGEHGLGHNKGIVSHHAPISQAWDWAGQGWMLGEAPLFLIDARYAFMNPPGDEDRPRCIFMPDAHHSIPFFYVTPTGGGEIDASDIRYEAPPRFDVQLEHSNDGHVDQSTGYWCLGPDGLEPGDPPVDPGILSGPSEWYIWMHDRSVKYTIRPVYDALPRIIRTDSGPAHGPTSMHDLPDLLFDDDTGDPTDMAYDFMARALYGIPFYGLVTSIEDGLGNRIEIEYCDAKRHDDPKVVDDGTSFSSEYPWIDENTDCVPCAQNCAERGQIRTVRLRTGCIDGSDGAVAWTLHYIYRKFTAPTYEFHVAAFDEADPSASENELAGTLDYENQHALATVLVYAGDEPGSPDVDCFTYGDPTPPGGGGAGTGGDPPGGMHGQDDIALPAFNPFDQFGLPMSCSYRIDYQYLDPWNPDHTAVRETQIRSYSCHYHKGLPYGLPGSTGWGVNLDTSTLATRSPRLIQVTTKTMLTAPGEHVPPRHTIYRYAGNRRQERPDDVGLDMVLTSRDLGRLRGDLADAQSTLLQNWPTRLHAFDEFDEYGYRAPIIDLVDSDDDPHLRDYATFHFERWVTGDVGVFWDPLTPDKSNYLETSPRADGSYSNHNTPWYSEQCYAYSAFHDELIKSFLLGVPNHGLDNASGKLPVALEDGVALISTGDGHGGRSTKRIYRFVVSPTGLLPPAGDGNPHEYWAGEIYGSGPPPDTIDDTNWMTSVIWEHTGYSGGNLLDTAFIRSLHHEPFQFQRDLANVADDSGVIAPAFAPWGEPVWVTVIDEYDSYQQAIVHAASWNTLAATPDDAKPASRRVVAMNAAGYVLWERTYDLSTGQLSSAHGIWEEFIYDWQADADDDEGNLDGIDVPWDPVGRLLQHRTVGWSAAMLAAADPDGTLPHPTAVAEGLVYVYEYLPVEAGEEPTLEIGAKGIQFGTQSSANVHWQMQRIPHPDRPSISQYEIYWPEDPPDGLLPFDVADPGFTLPADDSAIITMRAVRLEDVDGDPETDDVVTADVVIHPETTAYCAGVETVARPFTVRESVRAIDIEGDTWTDTWLGAGLTQGTSGLIVSSGGALRVPPSEEVLSGSSLAQFAYDLVRSDPEGREILVLKDVHVAGLDEVGGLESACGAIAIEAPSAHWSRQGFAPGVDAANAWILRDYDHWGRPRFLQTHLDVGQWWTYRTLTEEVTDTNGDTAEVELFETRQFEVRFDETAIGTLARCFPRGSIQFSLSPRGFGTHDVNADAIESLARTEQVQWTTVNLEQLHLAEYDVELTVELEREGGELSGVKISAPDEEPREVDIDLGKWGTIERELHANGTVTRRVSDEMGRLVRTYVGSSDTHGYWQGAGDTDSDGIPDHDGNADDDLVMTELLRYGSSVHDALQLTEARRFNHRPSLQYHLNAEPVDAVATETLGYDERMRHVYSRTDTVDAAGDPATPRVRCELLDGLDRSRFLISYGDIDGGADWVDPRGYRDSTEWPVASSILGTDPQSMSETIYDGLSRVVETREYDVSDPTGSSYLATRTHYDGQGREWLVEQPNGGFTRTDYDTLGRIRSTATCYDVAGDLHELTRTDNIYDRLERLVATHTWTRIADDVSGPVLSETNAVCQIHWFFYDEEGRTTASVQLGSGNAGDDVFSTSGPLPEHPLADHESPAEPYYEPVYEAAYGEARPLLGAQYAGDIPGYARISVTMYDEQGRVGFEQDTAGIVTRYVYNGYGEQIFVERNHGGDLGEPRERTAYRYDDSGRVYQIAAVLEGHSSTGAEPPYVGLINWTADDGSLQITQVDYTVDTDGDGIWDKLAEVFAGGGQPPSQNGNFVAAVRYPDPDTGQPVAIDTGDHDAYGADLVFTYFPNGSMRSRRDARGVTFTHDYDGHGQLTTTEADYPAAPPVGAWPADMIRAIERAYDDQGNLSLATAYDGSPSSGELVTENEFTYDARGNLLTDAQAYGHSVSTSTPRTTYGWAFSSGDAGSGGGNHDRLGTMQYPIARLGYPNGRTLQFSYGGVGSHADVENLITAIEGGYGLGTIATFRHLGDGRRLSRTWNNDFGGVPSTVAEVVALDAGSGAGYAHLDRFGRIKSLDITDDLGVTKHRYDYTRDANGDIETCIITQSGFDNTDSYAYEYDDLHRLVAAVRGAVDPDLADNVDWAAAPATRTRWGLDELGNWTGDLDAGVLGRDSTADLDGDGDFDDAAAGGAEVLQSLADAVDARNAITYRGGTPGGSGEFLHDASGNLIVDASHYYIYDAWNRLVQVHEIGSVHRDALSGEIVGAPGPWIVHFTYDALGRLIALQRPWPSAPDEVRVTRYYYDGARRIQEVNIDPIEGLQAVAQSTVPAGGSPPPPQVNRYLAYEYIYTPGYVDEFQLQIDSSGAVQHILQDANYNVVGLLDEQGAILEQHRYDPYGDLVGLDHLSLNAATQIGHQGLFYQRLDGDLTADPMAVSARGIYHNRNRTYHPSLGRFMQRDPNGTGQFRTANVGVMGAALKRYTGGFELSANSGDGLNLYGYLRARPSSGVDPEGLMFGLPDISLTSATRSTLQAYEWADTAQQVFGALAKITAGASAQGIVLGFAADVALDRVGGPALEAILKRYKRGFSARGRYDLNRMRLRGDEMLDFGIHRGVGHFAAVRQRFWRMAIGRPTPPKGTILAIDPHTSRRYPRKVTMELHHIYGRDPDEVLEALGTDPHHIKNLMPLWEWDHAKVDPGRHVSYVFDRWIECDLN